MHLIIILFMSVCPLNFTFQFYRRLLGLFREICFYGFGSCRNLGWAYLFYLLLLFIINRFGLLAVFQILIFFTSLALSYSPYFLLSFLQYYQARFCYEVSYLSLFYFTHLFLFSHLIHVLLDFLFFIDLQKYAVAY